MQCRAVSLSLAEAWKGFVMNSQIFQQQLVLWPASTCANVHPKQSTTVKLGNTPLTSYVTGLFAALESIGHDMVLIAGSQSLAPHSSI